MKMKTREMTFIAMFTVLICLCSWITVPGPVPFTMQTFAVFCALLMLGGKRGTVAIVLYILLGAVGLPVFSGFSGGIGRLFGATGGYIFGFALSGVVYRLIVPEKCSKIAVKVVAASAGLGACYLLGTVWFMHVYAAGSGGAGLMYTLGLCVFPFVLPDVLKIALAFVISDRLGRMIKL